jgi:hypothetical protein
MVSLTDLLIFVYFPLKNFSLIWDITTAGEGLKNLGSAVRTFD